MRILFVLSNFNINLTKKNRNCHKKNADAWHFCSHSITVAYGEISATNNICRL